MRSAQGVGKACELGSDALGDIGIIKGLMGDFAEEICCVDRIVGVYRSSTSQFHT